MGTENAAGLATRFGGWCSIPTPLGVEIMGRAGFDWMAVDMQHGLFTAADLVGALQILNALEVETLVRVPWNTPDAIMKALDAGADGVIIPMVNTADEAEAAVQATRFPPRGMRSWGPVGPSLRRPGYSPHEADASVRCGIQIETVEGIERLGEILAVPGIDLVYVGPSDLAISAGLEPTYIVQDDEHLAMVNSVVEACRTHDIATGIFSPDNVMALQWAERGLSMVTVATDIALLNVGAKRVLRDLRGPLGGTT